MVGQIMKTVQSLALSAALVIAMAAPASAVITDPEVIIYRFPGVLDDNAGAFAGTATAFHCTNFSGATESIRIVVRDTTGALKANLAFQIDHLVTLTTSTHDTVLYSENHKLDPGFVTQGTAAIAATSINIICTAMTLSAGASQPTGFALRGIRFNPVPGSQE